MPAQPNWVKGALLTLALSLVSATAWAQPNSFGVSAGAYKSLDDEADSRADVFGIRAAHRLKRHPAFGVEAGLSWSDLTDLFPVEQDPVPGLDVQIKVQLLNAELSGQWFPKGNGLVVFAGGGMSRTETRLRLTSVGEKLEATSTSNIFTAHAGAGYEWGLGGHLFVRPEARYRYYFSDAEPGHDLGISFDASGFEAGLVLGWRR
ncbi:MAG TPA: outer membrane beta-barrel protein [Thermoanaerobaculia bacterium]|jgi:hypothetical protein|nr:outer membrane beta-barrel protein [Thermoanaerobaculia bacterium]